MNLNAAGMDVGATEHWVAVPEDRDLALPTITRLRAVIRLELGLLIVIPLLAVLMARGIGRTL
jgi:uncharacterized membrane protein